jgi:hypothetical protein
MHGTALFQHTSEENWLDKWGVKDVRLVTITCKKTVSKNFLVSHEGNHSNTQFGSHLSELLCSEMSDL